MGLFKKKDDKKDSKKMNHPAKIPAPSQTVPKLPELPKLPDFPGAEDEYNSSETLPQLPSFPNNSFGDKFSQNTIKEAVAGEKEVEPEDAEDSMESHEDTDEMPMMQELPEEMPMPKMTTGMLEQKSYPSYSKSYTTQKKPEPVFIRLDKFEESMDIFNDAKEQISEISDLLKNIKEMKQKEDEELNTWENQIQEIKKQIEKVDQDIFSKI